MPGCIRGRLATTLLQIQAGGMSATALIAAKTAFLLGRLQSVIEPVHRQAQMNRNRHAPQ